MFNEHTCEMPAFRLAVGKWIPRAYTEHSDTNTVTRKNSVTDIRESHSGQQAPKDQPIFRGVFIYQLPPCQFLKAAKNICDPQASCFP